MSHVLRFLSLRQRLLLSHLAIFAIGALCVVALVQAGDAAQLRPTWVPGLVGGSIIIVLIGLVLSLSLSQRFSAPLEEVVSAARGIAAGRFETRVGMSSIPEANALAAGFNEMAEALVHYNATNIDRLLAEQRRNEAVLNCTDDGLIIVDDQARIERINPVAARQLGIGVDDGIGRTLDELLQRTLYDELIRHSVLHGAAPLQDPDVLVIGDDDTRRELAVTLAPFEDLTRPGLVLILRDVTRERRLDRLRSDFLMQASHELRTPVTTLNLTLHLLAERLPPAAGERETDLMHTAIAETDRLIDLVNSLLDLSRLQGGALMLQREEVAATALMKAVVESFRARADEQGVFLMIEAADFEPRLSVDAIQFPRVLSNLVDNALRHSHRGGHVVLAAHQNGPRVEISVRDEGEGIAAVHLVRIFEPFVQVGQRSGGAGLGLALCRELVQAHDGRLDVTSQPGQGSRFTIVLPAAG